MHLINVICSNCGHLISIPESVKHATCNGCQTPLFVKRTDSSIYTEALPLGRPSSVDVEAVNKVNNEDIYRKIEMLDNEWSIELEHYKLKGGMSMQSYKVALLLFVVFILMAVIYIVRNRNIDLSVFKLSIGPLGWAFLLVFVALFYKVIKDSIRSKAFHARKKKYEKQRTLLESQLK